MAESGEIAGPSSVEGLHDEADSVPEAEILQDPVAIQGERLAQPEVSRWVDPCQHI